MDGADRNEDVDARLAAAFRDAAEGAPPAGFDAAGIAAASRRITRRRRSAVAGAALAVLAVAGVGVTAGLTADPGGPATASSAAQGGADQNGDAARAAAPEAASGDLGSVPNQPPPLGPGTGECAERQDPALRTLVEQVLPEVVGAPAAMTTQECRSGGERGVALQVRDGERAGLLSVTYLPPGSTVRLTADAQAAATASGGTVLVFSTPDRQGQRPPFDERIATVVTYLAPRL